MSQPVFSQPTNQSYRGKVHSQRERQSSQAGLQQLQNSQGTYITQSQSSQDSQVMSQSYSSQISVKEKNSMPQANNAPHKQILQPQNLQYSRNHGSSKNNTSDISFPVHNGRNEYHSNQIEDFSLNNLSFYESKKLAKAKSSEDILQFQDFKRFEEPQQTDTPQLMEDHMRYLIDQGVQDSMNSFKHLLNLDGLDIQILFKLATTENPAIKYLYEEIEKTDEAFNDLFFESAQTINRLTNEWLLLKEELKSLQQLAFGQDEEEQKPLSSKEKQEIKGLRRRAAETAIKMSEDLMRESRADKILLFLKLRYPDQLNIEDANECENLKKLFDKYQKDLSEYDKLNLYREGLAVKGFLSEVEKMGYNFKLRQASLESDTVYGDAPEHLLLKPMKKSEFNLEENNAKTAKKKVGRPKKVLSQSTSNHSIQKFIGNSHNSMSKPSPLTSAKMTTLNKNFNRSIGQDTITEMSEFSEDSSSSSSSSSSSASQKSDFDDELSLESISNLLEDDNQQITFNHTQKGAKKLKQSQAEIKNKGKRRQ
ncbi:UNKNOWN [Stylonychia lemnae]|uniref:Uncharacterized protein n=1 Tax=Stylonychia lemnae TaxID=5949 RepID=A0A078ARB0_STYLE|nr:UNKNOWN [Stylonychia lemnae]|eukprot:CDW84975.1 UNKNOWN [Stylonychia lemnae]